jgi:hypothetical protein
MSEKSESISALQESISRKGNNSYYYAHGAKIDGPVWDGKEEPRLLASSSLNQSSKRKISQELDSFSWLDETSCIKIYIDFENALKVEDNSISLVNLFLI